MNSGVVQISPSARVSEDISFRGNGTIVISDYAEIDDGVILDSTGGGKIYIGSRAKLKTGCIIKCYGGTVRIGHRVTVGEYSVFSGHGGIEIGRYCMIAPFVMLNAASHILDGNEAYRFLGEKALGISIGENVWLGVRVTVLDGVNIGSNSVVGAHSLVNSNLHEYSKAFGSPAKVVGLARGK